MNLIPTEQTLADSIFGLAAADNALYAARASGLYRSVDGGATWADALASLSRSERYAVTALAAAGRTVFAGAPGAILRSEDGESWQVVGLASPPPTVVALAVSPGYAKDGIAATGTADDGIFISNDRGATWVPWNFGLIDPHVNALAFSPGFASDQVIFAGTQSGVFRSQNGGRSWRETAFPMEAAPVLSLAAAPDHLLYAGTESHGLFVSTDGGQTWEPGGFGGMAVNAIDTVSDGSVWLMLDDALACLKQGAVNTLALPDDQQALAMLVGQGGALVGCLNGDLLTLP